jgi:hypothetical protein
MMSGTAAQPVLGSMFWEQTDHGKSHALVGFADASLHLFMLTSISSRSQTDDAKTLPNSSLLFMQVSNSL